MTLLTSNTKEGEVFSGKPKRLSWERLWAFSGGPFNADDWPKKNVHTDLEFAQDVGLPSIAASATQYQGHLVSLLLDLFGENWLSHGTMSVKFIKIVDQGDVIQPKVKIQSIEQDGSNTNFTLEVWCDNQNDEKVLVGSATGKL